MIFAALLCIVGLAGGFLLLWRIPTCPASLPNAAASVSVIIPARNEEANLPRLLRSISASAVLKVEVLVVDDHSMDRTAEVAREAGVKVIGAEPLPAGWTGKAWACYQGAQFASGDLLLFLDADTYFAQGGLDRLIARWMRENDPALAMSLLPFHEMQAAYEELSLVFFLLMAAGAGGFGAFSKGQLFGQSLLISRENYFAANGHAAVRGYILENLKLADHLKNSGCRMLCLGGRNTFQVRMFPDGLRQMSDSWAKAFIQGASSSGGGVLVCSAIWIACLWMAVILFAVPSMFPQIDIVLAYLLFGLQIFWAARRLGNYSLVTCLLYPLPLSYYCVVFARSALRSVTGQKTVWRGREV